MTMSAPSSVASSELVVGDVDRGHGAPAIFAYCTARWPSPPTPEIATSCAGRTPATLSALYVVTPAQVSGAASRALTPVGHRLREVGPGEHLLGVCAVAAVAGVDLLLAQRLPAGQAVLAPPARLAEPRHGDPLPDGQVGHALAELLHQADALVAGDERRVRLDRPVSVRGVDVGVAQPRGLHPDADLAGAGLAGRGAPR